MTQSDKRRPPAVQLCSLLVLLGALPVLAEAPPAAPERVQVGHLRVTVLSTMRAKQGVGEWGFAALVEADGQRLLFDTGAHPRTVLDNAKALGVDLSTVSDVVLSHSHGDHTGGLVALRQALKQQNPAALARAHVGRGLFWSRPRTQAKGAEGNPMLAVRPRYEASGGRFIEHAEPVELLPGVWLTGPVPRMHPEHNWSGQGRVRSPDGLVEDTVPEDQALVFDTAEGLVVLTGCGHAGIINVLELARARVRPAPVAALLGGLHLFAADETTLAWTGGKLREFQVGALLGAHCTGSGAVLRLRALAGLTRETCGVGAVGSTYESGRGLDPLDLAR